MAAANLQLTISSALDDAGFKSLAAQVREGKVQLDSVESKGKNVNEVFSKLGEIVGKISLIEFMRRAADEASDNEQAQMRLKTAVESSGKSWDRNKDSVNAYIKSLSEASRFTGSELEAAFTVLLNRTHDVTVSQNLLKTAMGINVSTGKDLIATSEALGSAANGNVFGLRELSREFGINGDAAKNADKVLATLTDRFGKAAVAEDSAKQSSGALKSAWHELLGTVGVDVGAAFQDIENFTTKTLKAIIGVYNTVAGLVNSAYALIVGKNKLFNEEFQRMADGLNTLRHLFDKAVPEAAEKGGKLTTDAAHRMSDELKSILQGLEKDTLQNRAITTDQKLAALEKEKENEKRIIMQRADFAILSEKDKVRILAAIDADYNAKKLQIERETAKKIVDNTRTYMEIIGKATGEGLAGQKDAWHNALLSIIDAIATTANAQIAMITETKVAEALEAEDYYGAAKAAAIGAIEIGAVSALAAGAKSALGGGDGSSGVGSSGSGTGWSNSGQTQATSTSTPAKAQQPTYTINIQGSVVGDINELARRLSDAVQNKNVRMVATQVKGNA